jgi:DNA-3-methyladenine glycosylase
MRLVSKLGQKFFLQNTDEVAKQLLGKEIRFTKNDRNFTAIITETESYHGADPASHGSKGKTKRSEVMFLSGGRLYVYLIYGMYFCLNFTTENEGYPSAVLIRSVKLIAPEARIINGPGRLCRDLVIDREFNEINICKENQFQFQCCDIGLKPDFVATKRVGITKNQSALLRFVAIQ